MRGIQVSRIFGGCINFSFNIETTIASRVADMGINYDVMILNWVDWCYGRESRSGGGTTREVGM